MSIFRAGVLAALLAYVPSAVFSDGIPFAMRAPLPQVQEELPTLPVTPAGFDVLSISALPKDEGSLLPIMASQRAISAFGISCKEEMTVDVVAGAMLSVSLSAPCRPEAKVVISHAGLEFENVLSYAGLLEFELPALEPTGTVEAKFSPEQILYDRARVADLADFTRLAIAWEDGAPMAIKASAPDHMPVSIEILGSKGSLHILSYQDDPRQEPGVVRLALEREVDAATCAEGARGSVLKIMPDLPALRYKLKVAAPGCAQIGEMFLLKNALQDLKLAKR